MKTRRLNPIAWVEDRLAGVFEGAVGKVFRSRLQPVEMVRRLEREMDENLTVSPNRRVAANAYQLFISQNDYERFAPTLPALLKSLQDSVIAAARRHGYTLTTRPVVKILVDPQLGTGEQNCSTFLLDSTQLQYFANQGVDQQSTALPPTVEHDGPVPSRAPSAPLMGNPDATQLFGQGPAFAPPMPGGPVAAPAMPFAALVMRTAQGPGQQYPLNRDVIHIGRHTENDIVINDKRVSRVHAEIKYQHGQFVLFDLGSLNGVLINGVALRQATLRNGDILAFGNYSFVFERR